MKKHQTGAGLLTALILLMLITSIIATIAVVTHYDIRRHRMLRHAETAQGMMDGAMKLALDTISSDGSIDRMDSHKDFWAQPLPPYPVDGGYVRGEVRSLSSAFNLYALTLSVDAQREQYEKLFRRLCDHLGVSPIDASKIIDPMRTTDLRNGAKSPMDLMLDLDLKETTTDALHEWLYYYPVLDGFNVNLLDSDMWQILTGMDKHRADLLVNELTTTPVREANAFMLERFRDNTLTQGIVFDSKTRFFEIITEAQIGDMNRATAIQVFRMSGGNLRILSRRTIE